MTSGRKTDARSFRDPDGSLIFEQGRVFRLVRPQVAATLDDVLARPTVVRWMRDGGLIGTRAVEKSSLPSTLRELPYAVYEHDIVPFVSYAHEWPPAMLVRAAELTLELSRDLLEIGLLLKDATPANVLFRGSQPVFVDILSIVPRQNGSYLWLAANQFESTFLLPLIANAETGVPLSWLLQDTFSGISHAQVARLLGVRRWSNPSLIGSVALPASLSTRNGRLTFTEPKQSNDDVARFILERALKRYQKKIARVGKRRPTSFWKRYTATRTHYADVDLDEKKAFVTNALNRTEPRWTLDIGANTGEFSALAARISRVVAMDIDETSAGEIFARANESKLDIHTLVGNFARPSPGLGWRNAETLPFLQRARKHFDLVLMLAVIHHLRISAGIPIAAILETVSEVTDGYLVIEHVPPSDPMFLQLARGRESLYADCQHEAFKAEVETRFGILETHGLPNGRTLYLGKRLVCA